MLTLLCGSLIGSISPSIPPAPPTTFPVVRSSGEELRRALLAKIRQDGGFDIPHCQLKAWVKSLDNDKQMVGVIVKEYQNDKCVRLIEARHGRFVFDDGLELFLHLESIQLKFPTKIEMPSMKIRLSPGSCDN